MPQGSPALAPGATVVWHSPDPPSPDPCMPAPAQNCSGVQSSFVRQPDPPDAGVHLPWHGAVEEMTHMDPFAHATSSTQASPSATLPENAAKHGSGMLGRFKMLTSQSRLDSVAMQDAACCASNRAVPFDTAVTAADGTLKLTRANSGPIDALQTAAFGNLPHRIAQVQYAAVKSATQVEAVPMALLSPAAPPALPVVAAAAPALPPLPALRSEAESAAAPPVIPIVVARVPALPPSVPGCASPQADMESNMMATIRMGGSGGAARHRKPRTLPILHAAGQLRSTSSPPILRADFLDLRARRAQLPPPVHEPQVSASSERPLTRASPAVPH
jgi:hypothetical protein